MPKKLNKLIDYLFIGTYKQCYFSCDFSVTVSVKVVRIQIFQLQLKFQLIVNRFFSMSFSFKIFQFKFKLLISVI